MNIKKVNGGVWVKASEELPDIEWKGICRVDGQPKNLDAAEVKWYFQSYPLKPIEWLKPVEGYVLSEQEITDIKFQEYNRGVSDGRKWAETPF